MEKGIRRALAKAGTGKDHPLGDYKGLFHRKIVLSRLQQFILDFFMYKKYILMQHFN